MAVAVLVGLLVRLRFMGESTNYLGADPSTRALLAELGAHPSRDMVVGLAHCARIAESPAALADGAMERLEELSRRLEIQRGVATLNRAAGLGDEQQALRRLHDRLRASKVPPSIPDAPHVGATAPVEGSK